MQPKNQDLIKQLDFIIDMCPRVFMNTPLDAAIFEIKRLRAQKVQDANLCPLCNKNKASPNNTIDSKSACAECYFDMLGDLVESHPVGRP